MPHNILPYLYCLTIQDIIFITKSGWIFKIPNMFKNYSNDLVYNTCLSFANLMASD